MSRTNWPAVITGIAIGLGIGAALGILFAPQSGEDTREYLLGTAKDRMNEAKDRLTDAGDRVRDRLSDVVESGKDMARQAQGSVDKVRDQIKNLSEAGQRSYREARNT